MTKADVSAAVGKGSLSGRVAIVTGSAQGIGAAFALALAAEGANIIICDLLPVDAIKAEVEALGVNVLAEVTDCVDPDSIAGLVEHAIAMFGRVDVLVNNAALFSSIKPKPFTEISAEEWDRVMMINTRGPFECSKAVVPAMRKQGSGKIINISSGTVLKGSPMLAHYVASKGAIVALTRTLARALGGDGISVNCIAPGSTLSTEARRMAAATNVQGRKTVESRCFQREQIPEDIVGTLVFLASPASDFITGQTIVVDGGSVFN